MTRQIEFALTLDLPCSAGWLVYELETRVTVEYEYDAGSIDWELKAVRIDGEPGTIRKGDPVWFLFEDAVKIEKNANIIVQECGDDWDDRLEDAA